MDGASIGGIDISIDDAFTSRAFDISTKDLAQYVQAPWALAAVLENRAKPWPKLARKHSKFLLEKTSYGKQSWSSVRRTGKSGGAANRFPKLSLGSRKCEHGVILKLVSTNICGSDQHMVRGRTTAPVGMVLGHEITGEIIEKGRDVEFLNVGDLVSAPFNIACGGCRNCREGKTGICTNVNGERAGAAFGYVDMGGWITATPP